VKHSNLNETLYPCHVRVTNCWRSVAGSALPWEADGPVLGRFLQESNADLAASFPGEWGDTCRKIICSGAGLPAEPGAVAEYAVREGLKWDLRGGRLVQIVPVAGELMIYLSTSLFFFCLFFIANDTAEAIWL